MHANKIEPLSKQVVINLQLYQADGFSMASFCFYIHLWEKIKWK